MHKQDIVSQVEVGEYRTVTWFQDNATHTMSGLVKSLKDICIELQTPEFAWGYVIYYPEIEGIF